MKLGIIGAAGRRGTLAAYAAAMKGCFSEIKLFDDRANAAAAVAMDLNQALTLSSAVEVRAVSSISEMSDCKVILSVYSVNYQDVKDRQKEAEMNYELAVRACAELKTHCSDSVIMVSVNPVDSFVYLYRELLGCEPGRVIGVGASDTIRFKWALSKVTGLPASAFDALCAGKTGHGIQLYGDISRNGEPFSLSETDQKQVEELCVGWFKDWAAQKAGLTADCTLSSAFAEMAEAVALDSKRTFACSTVLAERLGYKGCSMNFNVVLGANGAEDIIIPKVSDDEDGFLKLFAGKINESISSIRG